MEWKKVAIGGKVPNGLKFHTATTINTKICVLGGTHANGKPNEFLVFDTKTMDWVEYKTHGTRPEKLLFHTATLVDHRVFVIGAYKQDILYIFDALTLTWTKPETQGTLPVPGIHMHSAYLVGNLIYVFGGCDDNNHRFNDMYTLDTQTLTWTKVNALGAIPQYKDVHSGVLIQSVIATFSYGDKSHIFDIPTNTWHLLQLNRQPTEIPSSIAVGKFILVLGIDSKKTAKACQLIDLKHMLTTTILEGVADPPSYRVFHTCCIVKKKLFMIGGFDGKHKHFNGVYTLDLNPCYELQGL